MRRSLRECGCSRVAAVAVLLVSLGCGSNKPELPAGSRLSSGCVAAGYPEGPYGTEPGSVIENACFQGFSAPDRQNHGEDDREPVAISDFLGTHAASPKLLLINTAAVWCQACRIEHESLPKQVSEFAPRGLAVLGALFQDRDRNPANTSDLAQWVELFETNFPMVLDPDYHFGLYASAETAPLNLVVETKTMTILQRYIGDQSAVMWPYIESQLEAR